MDLIEPRSLVAEALDCTPDSLEAEAALGRHPNWDSFGHLNLMIALEQHYGVAITDETVERYATLGAVTARFNELRSQT
ncbi:MAG: acyl carrier protein [Kiloniellales bacterium]|nr:acyl carrier protein [Kiloniellales bacterium]